MFSLGDKAEVSYHLLHGKEQVDHTKPKRRAVAKAFRSVERSLSSSNSFRAANIACSSIVHVRCGSAGRAKDAISTDKGSKLPTFQ